jgi:hypothetical protein
LARFQNGNYTHRRAHCGPKGRTCAVS